MSYFWLYILISILILASVYFLLPELLFHLFGTGSWKRQYSPGVSLTFDDGPDPLYTPRLLAILSRLDVKACFFVVGEKAEKYPEIVKMIHDQGHLIGSHGYYHRHSWLMSPFKTCELWNKSLSIIEQIIGSKPDLIRPPWGGFNFVLFFWSLARSKRIVLWSTHGCDWRRKRAPSSIIKRVLKHTREGSIILLHDSGGQPGAPENTLTSVEGLCSEIRENLKLPVVPLAFPSWSLLRRISFRVWEKWEHLYARVNRIKRINDNNLFRLTLTRYHGPVIYKGNGEVLASKGDVVGEIHLDNIRLQAIGADIQKAGIRALRLVRHSFAGLAEYIASNPEHKNVKIYLGITMLNRGVRGLGFQVQEYPSHFGRILGFFQKIIMHVYHPSGGKRKMESLGTSPKLVWISKEALLNKYGRRNAD